MTLSWHCWLHDHMPMRTLKRTPDGKAVVPHVIVWVCSECQGVLGETTGAPRWSLVARLRRQRARRGSLARTAA